MLMNEDIYSTYMTMQDASQPIISDNGARLPAVEQTSLLKRSITLYSFFVAYYGLRSLTDDENDKLISSHLISAVLGGD